MAARLPDWQPLWLILAAAVMATYRIALRYFFRARRTDPVVFAYLILRSLPSWPIGLRSCECHAFCHCLFSKPARFRGAICAIPAAVSSPPSSGEADLNAILTVDRISLQFGVQIRSANNRWAEGSD